MSDVILTNELELSLLIENNLLNQFVKDVSFVTGVTCSIITSDNTYLVEPPTPKKACTDFIQATVGIDKCKQCDSEHIWKATIEGAHNYLCWTNLLTDIVAPIKIGENVVAALFGGQIRNASIDISKFEEFSDEIGIKDKKGFISSLKELPIMREEEINRITKLISLWASYICVFAQQQKNIELQLSTKTQELELVHEAIQIINNPSFSLRDTLETIRNKSMELVNGQTGCCCLVNPITGSLTHEVKCDYHNIANHCGIEKKDGIIQMVSRTKKMKYITEVKKETNYEPAFSWVKSKITIPLIHQDRIVGILNIDGDKEHAFDKHIIILQILAGQAAIAVENSFLREETNETLRKRIRDFSSLFKIAMSMSENKIGDILQIVLRESIQLVQGDFGTIRFADDQKRELYIKEIWPPTLAMIPGFKAKRFDYDKSRGGNVYIKQQPYFCNNVEEDSLDQCHDITKAKSNVIVPLTFGEQKYGVISIDSERYNTFSIDSEKILSLVSNIAAIVYSSANVYDNTKRRQEIAVQVFTFAQRVVSSLKLYQVLKPIVFYTCDIISAEECSVFILNDNNYLILRATTSKLQKHLVNNAKYKIGEGFTGIVAQEGKTKIVNDIQEELVDSHKYPEIDPSGISTWIGVPIFKKGKIYGVIRLTNKVPSPSSPTNEFTSNDAELLETMSLYIGAWDK